MPNIKSAMKRVKVSEKKQFQNRAVKKAYKDAIKNFELAIESNSENKKELYTIAVSKVDKAWSKGVIVKNTAARRKAYLTRLLNK